MTSTDIALAGFTAIYLTVGLFWALRIARAYTADEKNLRTLVETRQLHTLFAIVAAVACALWPLSLAHTLIRRGTKALSGRSSR